MPEDVNTSTESNESAETSLIQNVEIENKSTEVAPEETKADKVLNGMYGDPNKEETEETDEQSKDQPETKAKDEKDPESEESKDDKKDDSYTYEMPEGTNLDEGLMEVVNSKFKELNINQEQAQAIVEEVAKYSKEAAEKAEAEVRNLRKEWVDATKKAEGDYFERNQRDIAKAISFYGNKDLLELLQTTWMGDNPLIRNLLLNVGRSLNEDTLITAAPDKGEPTDADKLNALYGKPKK